MEVRSCVTDSYRLFCSNLKQQLYHDHETVIHPERKLLSTPPVMFLPFNLLVRGRSHAWWMGHTRGRGHTWGRSDIYRGEVIHGGGLNQPKVTFSKCAVT